MKASDFRIGNQVMLNGQVKTITPRDIERIAEQENFGITSSYSNIEITEQWLFKFGFKYTGGDGYKSPCGELYYFSLRKDLMSFGLRYTQFIGCKYIHHLQNLYFALTGEELTIKT